MGPTIVIFCLGFASLVNGELLIQGSNQNVMEGDRVTLKCSYSENGFNISRVTFESYSGFLQMWRPVWYGSSWCFYNMKVEQRGDEMVLEVPHIAYFSEGVFRCVSDDPSLSLPNNVSNTFSLKVHYLRDMYLSREGSISLLGLSQELRVRQGDDVVLKCSATSSEEPNFYWSKEDGDWIMPSAMLTLNQVTPMDSGVYTCNAEQPTMMLNKSRNISLVVLPNNISWFQTNAGKFMLMTSMGVIITSLFLLVAMGVYIQRRKKQVIKIPSDDKPQTKPIYKDSMEALHSNCGDKQPLVTV
ncbi:B-cell receptor CD22 [Stigmatopora nigra]